jgi:hypothetical protein
VAHPHWTCIFHEGGTRFALQMLVVGAELADRVTA